jgi:hypothetical protein
MQRVRPDVREVQQRFVASNVFSIAHSKVEPGCAMQAVYDRVVMIGFMMYGYDESEGCRYVQRPTFTVRLKGPKPTYLHRAYGGFPRCASSQRDGYTAAGEGSEAGRAEMQTFVSNPLKKRIYLCSLS